MQFEIMATTKTQHVHMRLATDVTRMLDCIVAARIHEGIRDRTKAVEAMIRAEHQRVCVPSEGSTDGATQARAASEGSTG